MKRKLSSAISLLTKATTKMRTSKCLEEEMKTVVNQNTVRNNNRTFMKVQYYTAVLIYLNKYFLRSKIFQ